MELQFRISARIEGGAGETGFASGFIKAKVKGILIVETER